MSGYVIVKHAQESVWPYYFEDNPMHGVHPSYSAHLTHTGRELNLRSLYAQAGDAQEDLQALLECNPVGAYAICPVKISN